MKFEGTVMRNTTTSTRKTALFMMRISPEHKEILEKAAEARGLSLAWFLRANGLAAAKSEGDLIAA